MKTKTCIELDDLAFPVKVEQTGVNRFTVTCGLEVQTGLSYVRAAEKFGLAVFHALACVGKLDNTSIKGEL